MGRTKDHRGFEIAPSLLQAHARSTVENRSPHAIANILAPRAFQTFCFTLAARPACLLPHRASRWLRAQHAYFHTLLHACSELAPSSPRAGSKISSLLHESHTTLDSRLTCAPCSACVALALRVPPRPCLALSLRFPGATLAPRLPYAWLTLGSRMRHACLSSRLRLAAGMLHTCFTRDPS